MTTTTVHINSNACCIPGVWIIFCAEEDLSHFLVVTDAAQFWTRFTAQADARVVTLQQFWTRLIAHRAIAWFAAQAAAAVTETTQKLPSRTKSGDPKKKFKKWRSMTRIANVLFASRKYTSPNAFSSS